MGLLVADEQTQNVIDFLNAVDLGNLKQLQEILQEKEVDVNVVDNMDQRSALHLACEKGHLDIVKYLIKVGKGLDLDWQNTFGNTALHWAASDGHIRIAEILLDAGAKTDLQNRFTLKTPLHWAAEEGNLEFVRLLIKFKADLEVKHVAGYTALHEAAKYGHYDVVKTLLYHKASRDSKGLDGKTAKDLAAASEAFKVTALIDRYPERLREGAYKNRAETVVDIIISMGVDIDDADMDTGDTAMHLAAMTGHHNIVNILSEYGANPNLTNNEGDMPLHLACRLGKEGLQAATKLIQGTGTMSANLDAVDPLGNTPLVICAAVDCAPLALLCLRMRANFNTSNGLGQTALYWAASHGNIELCSKLTGNGANLEVKDKENGHTPLAMAAIKGHHQVINHLLQCGSHVEARDKLNNTPLHNAAMNGQKQAVMALLHGGASCSSKGANGKTAVDMAVEAYKDPELATPDHNQIVNSLTAWQDRLNRAAKGQ